MKLSTCIIFTITNLKKKFLFIIRPKNNYRPDCKGRTGNVTYWIGLQKSGTLGGDFNERRDNWTWLGLPTDKYSQQTFKSWYTMGIHTEPTPSSDAVHCGVLLPHYWDWGSRSCIEKYPFICKRNNSVECLTTPELAITTEPSWFRETSITEGPGKMMRYT